ncbi:MAG: hypothetical protein ACK56F_14040, partial [bacterium]
MTITSSCLSSDPFSGAVSGISATTDSVAGRSFAAGIAAAVGSSTGTGGLLPLGPAHRPDGPGTANSSSVISPS